MANNDWINKVIEDTLQGKQFGRRIQSGIDHLQGKKLYKYYSLSSEFTIPNIKNGTIYLQNPILFNDPFDCNMAALLGISRSGAYEITSYRTCDYSQRYGEMRCTSKVSIGQLKDYDIQWTNYLSLANSITYCTPPLVSPRQYSIVTCAHNASFWVINSML